MGLCHSITQYITESFYLNLLIAHFACEKTLKHCGSILGWEIVVKGQLRSVGDCFKLNLRKNEGSIEKKCYITLMENTCEVLGVLQYIYKMKERNIFLLLVLVMWVFIIDSIKVTIFVN